MPQHLQDVEVEHEFEFEGDDYVASADYEWDGHALLGEIRITDEDGEEVELTDFPRSELDDLEMALQEKADLDAIDRMADRADSMEDR